MTTNYHTPIATGAAANASAVNGPLAELDETITNLATVTKDGHIIQDEGVDLAQQQRINFTGEGVTATNTPGITVVTVPKYTGYNSLINGGFDYAYRQTPGSYTTIAQDGYGPDRWRSSRENADVQYIRADGLSETGLTSQYYGTYKKITNAGKMMIYQIIEGREAVAMRGKTVTFQAQIKTSSAKTIRMAVIQLQSAGTIDTIPATFVTAWGANTVDPTLGANLAIITAAQSKSSTTAMQVFSVSVTVPANSKNLICAIWTDSQFAVNDTLSIGEAGHYIAATTQSWSPQSQEQELMRTMRFGEPVDYASGQFLSATVFGAAIKFNFPKRAAPTLTLLNTSIAVTELGVGSRSASAGTMVSVQANSSGARCELTGFSGAVTQNMGVITDLSGGFIYANSEL